MEQVTKKQNHTPKQLNRDTLYERFENGMRPSGNDFKDLIYSSLNKLDDGISKSFKHGLKLSPQTEQKDLTDTDSSGRVISFYEVINGEEAAWTISLVGEKGNKSLSIATGNNPKSNITIAQDGTLNVGSVNISSKIGTHAEGVTKADGEWHTLLDNLEGCNMFEVVAMAHSERGEGKYASIHAIASNAYAGKKGRIHCNRNFYGWKFWNRISLRWVGNEFNYKLQIKTHSNYGSNGKIEFNIMKLNRPINYSRAE
ncbi:hypothetical protein [Lacinutrix chionoecetis]